MDWSSDLLKTRMRAAPTLERVVMEERMAMRDPRRVEAEFLAYAGAFGGLCSFALGESYIGGFFTGVALAAPSALANCMGAYLNRSQPYAGIIERADKDIALSEHPVTTAVSAALIAGGVYAIARFFDLHPEYVGCTTLLHAMRGSGEAVIRGAERSRKILERIAYRGDCL